MHTASPALLLALLPAPTLFAAGAPAQPAPGTPNPAVHAVPFSHEDVGYADNLFVLRTENRLENMFRALRFCDETADWPEADRYRYQQEVSEPLPFFLSACTPAERSRFAKYMNEGRIRVAASHTTVLADRLNPEAAAHLFYVGARHLPDMLGVPPAKVAMIDDTTGLPWSLPIYCEAAQVPWLFHGHNGGGRCDELDAAPLVRWRGAGGTGAVLVHGETYNLHHGTTQPLPGFAAKAAPDNLPLFLYGWDFAVADRSLSDFAQNWNPKHPAEKVRVSTLEDWFPAEASLKAPPEVSGKTGPCQWMDQPIGDAATFGRARMAAERLPAAEKWNTVALALAPKEGRAWPWFDFTTGWHALLSNFEHTAGAACWRCKNEEGFAHYETEQVEHREEAGIAVDASVRTLDSALGALAARIASPHKEAVAVFNPSGRARSEAVSIYKLRLTSGLPEQAPPEYAVVDDATGEKVPCQLIDGLITFLAKDVPALGYRSYHLEEAAPLPRAAETAPGVQAESPFYRLDVDPASGCVTSLFDKELGRELVKRDQPQAFNQYLRLHIETPRKRDFLASPKPSDAKITVERGPVADIVRIKAKTENTRSFEQAITLWHGVKRVDFALELDKEPSGRTLADYFANNLHGKEACFASMPFDIPDFKTVYQTGGGGVAEPVKDQFKGTGTAHHAVQHFADLSNKDFGVTVSPVDCALVEFGPARADAISRVMNDGGEARFEKNAAYPAESTLHLYLMSNMFSTNIRIDQPGPHAFHWALRSHKGSWEEGNAAVFGEDVNQPLAARWLPEGPRAGLPIGAHSFAQVDAPNVSLSTVKAAEWNGDGVIVRLVETSGHATTATFKAPFLGTLAKAEETSLTETNLGKPLALKDGAATVDLPAYGVKTLRLVPASAAPAQVAGLAAKPLSDMRVELAWQPAKDAAFYRVYRGDAADFKPTPINLVAVCAQARLVDQAQNHGAGWLANRLRGGATYFYKVEPVSRHNLRGPLSQAVSATTATQPTCAPGPVADPHAVTASPLEDSANFIALLWRSNVEPNVVAYEIHRDTVAGFAPSDKTLLARLPVREAQKATRFKGLDHQEYLDKTAKPGTAYHYRIRAVTKDGLLGDFSAETSATTKSGKAKAGAAAETPSGAGALGNDAAR